jgi:hypothetical protein
MLLGLTIDSNLPDTLDSRIVSTVSFDIPDEVLAALSDKPANLLASIVPIAGEPLWDRRTARIYGLRSR